MELFRRRRRGTPVVRLSLALGPAALLLALSSASAFASPKDVTVAITSPGPGQVVSGPVSWTAAATGADHVTFAVDGTVRWTDYLAPYVYGGDGNTLDTASLSDGPHTLTVTAVGAGRSVSASETVIVRNASTAPARGLAVETITPADGAVLSGRVPWRAAVTAGSAVRVDFALDGVVRWNEFLAPYVFDGDQGSLDTTTLSDGRHRLTVTAVSASGATSTSTIEVDVANHGAALPPAPSPVAAAPAWTTPPSIAGDAVVGKVLRASAGTWTNAPTSYDYRWQRCDENGGGCAFVPGAHGASFSLLPVDRGTTVRVVVTAANRTGSASATSAPTGVVSAAGPASTSDAASPTWASETAYTRTRPAFTALREIDVTSQSELAAAIANLRPGDDVKATRPFTVTGQFAISKSLAGPAEIELDGVSFVGGSRAAAAVWVHDSQNLRIFGGDITNPWDFGLLINSGHDVLWWGFTIHDTGGSGLGMLPNGGDIVGYDVAGTISHWGGNLSVDPHAEKGTGLHGAILADVAGPYTFDDNRMALDVSDGPTGAGVEIGDADGSQITGNTLYLRARDLTMVARRQVGGNAFQEWGSSPIGLTIPFLEASHLTGRAVDENGVYAGTSMARTVVDYGVASTVCLNSDMNEPIPAGQAWDPRADVTYRGVTTTG